MNFCTTICSWMWSHLCKCCQVAALFLGRNLILGSPNVTWDLDLPFPLEGWPSPQEWELYCQPLQISVLAVLWIFPANYSSYTWVIIIVTIKNFHEKMVHRAETKAKFMRFQMMTWGWSLLDKLSDSESWFSPERKEKDGRKDMGSAIQLWAVHVMILASVSSSVNRDGQSQLYLRSLSTLKCSDVSPWQR